MYTRQQQIAYSLIKSDLKFIYNAMRCNEYGESNYYVAFVPYIGMTIDGIENWIRTMNNSTNANIKMPVFDDELREFCAQLRETTKLWDMSYGNVYSKLRDLYQQSEEYFSNKCKRFAKCLNLYDVYGVDKVNQKYFGNTILDGLYLPKYNIVDSIQTGKMLYKLGNIAGQYIVSFNAAENMFLNTDMLFKYEDYGGFTKSPIGNKFSNRFVIFSILCQVNFIVYCVDKFIIDDSPTKLRYAYILYYYIANNINEINRLSNTRFYINDKLVNRYFRNCMTHYKIGPALHGDEIIEVDPMFGMTQKFLLMDYFGVKKFIYNELRLLSEQMESYLNI